MDVTLRPELQKLIEDEVKSGRSADPNDFLSKAVYHFVLARDLGQDFTQAELDQMIAEGLDDIDRGDVLDLRASTPVGLDADVRSFWPQTNANEPR